MEKNLDYTKMMICMIVIIGGMAIPTVFASLPAMFFVCIMYQDQLAKNIKDIIEALDKAAKDD